MSDELPEPRSKFSPFYCGMHEARLDAILEAQKEIRDTLAQMTHRLDQRVARLERWRSGLVATLTLVSSYLGLDKLFHLRMP